MSAGHGHEARGGGAPLPLQLAWSPSGNQLCLVASRPGGWPDKAIEVLDLSRGAAGKPLGRGLVSPECWSPDGKQIGFLGQEDGGIWVADVVRGATRWVTDCPGPEADPTQPEPAPPLWSPSGKWLAFQAVGDLWLVRPDGRDLRRLTRHLEAGSPLGRQGRGGGRGGTFRPAGGISSLPYDWSHDGRLLAYPRPEPNSTHCSLHALDMDTNQDRALSNGPAVLGIKAIAWQPGGRQLAALVVESVGHQKVWLVSDTGAKTVIPTESGTPAIIWTGDGRRLLVRGTMPDQARLRVQAVEVSRGTTETLSPLHFLTDPSVTVIAAKPGSDDFAFCRGNDIYLARADGSQWRKVVRNGRVGVVGVASPLVRWQHDPVVARAARRWREVVGREEGDEASQELIARAWRTLYTNLAEPQRARMGAGELVPYRELPARQQQEAVTAFAYRAFSMSTHGGDPAAMVVPDWYWWLDEGRLGFTHDERHGLVFALEQPGGDRMVIPVAESEGTGAPGMSASDRDYRGRHPSPFAVWWSVGLGCAAVVAVVLSWVRRGKGR